MELLNKFVFYVQTIQTKQLLYYKAAVLGAICILIGFVLFTINNSNHALLLRIQQTQVLATKAAKIIDGNKQMIAEEQRLKDLLDKNKEFTIKGFFEQFCREQNVTPEPGWDAHPESINEKFDEIVLQATVKKITSQQLVQIIDALNKKEIIYIKELAIHNEGNSTISSSITIATKTYKSTTD